MMGLFLKTIFVFKKQIEQGKQEFIFDSNVFFFILKNIENIKFR